MVPRYFFGNSWHVLVYWYTVLCLADIQRGSMSLSLVAGSMSLSLVAGIAGRVPFGTRLHGTKG